ncbi:YadA-like family protein (plasmid) [Pseudomonas aeruginosa]|nr:YadA-like family protein [Pseudomonas aeruginosa]HBO1428192.1 YadA-like family protein [Pseudomonas aeruginosa]HBO1496107.1 YadA-like family protein [Pseudomonas aeruginosa]HCH7475230.1 YadA-like family protein [Pseudomonas aeruginosa]HCH7804285.1 YadA-like family protein [Pseudomonas aeruginosa]
MCTRDKRAKAAYCRSKKFLLTGAAILSVASTAVNAANTVDSRFTNTVITGDGNSVTGNRDTHFSGATSANDQVIVGNHNTLNNTMSSEIIGNYNTVTNSDIAVKGESNKVSNAYGQLVGDSNTIDAANGTTTVIGSSNNVTGQSNTAIGNGNTMTGRGSVAIGDTTSTTSSNSITLGTGSQNNRDNTVSVGAAGGERQITNVRAGTAGTDAVNLSQMQAADVQTLNSANYYTDSREVAIRQDMYAGDVNTLNSANHYTDQRIDALDNSFNDALAGAYNYVRKENQQMRQEYRAIGALAMATAAIGIGPKDLGRSQFGFGMGTVQSASAMAIGLNHYVNDSTVVTFRGAIGTSKAVSGASFGVVKGW